MFGSSNWNTPPTPTIHSDVGKASVSYCRISCLRVPYRHEDVKQRRRTDVSTVECGYSDSANARPSWRQCSNSIAGYPMERVDSAGGGLAAACATCADETFIWPYVA